MRKRFFWLMILAFVGAHAYAASWTSENLIPNPGFEGGGSLSKLNWAGVAEAGGKVECAVELGAGRAEMQAIRTN